MASPDFELPPLLHKLLAAGRWPRTGREAMSQDQRLLIAPERVRLFAPEENCIYLVPPPFRTVADEASSSSRKFWSEFGALDEISPAHSLIIGDFGLGSDAPIILDYRAGGVTPPILRLRWFETASAKKTRWVRGADSFDEFANLLGLGLSET